MSTVTFNGARLNDSDASGGWSNFNVSGQSPSSEPQLKYQGNGAVNKKVNATTSRGGVGYSHGSNTDMTSASFPLFILKGKVGDAGDLNNTYGCEGVVGSGSGAYYSYNISGSSANNDQFIDGYNSQGGLAEGYLIVAINPNIAQWRETTNGSPNISQISFFAFAAQFVTGGAKSENVALDAIDIGVGLNYSGSNFTFQDAVDTDQNIITNRWGLACANGSVITLRGLHRLLSGISGTDTSIVLFPDGYHGTSNFGIEYNTTSSTASLNGSYNGLGRIYGNDDTRPDLTFLNTGSASTHSGSFNNFRLIQLQSVITMDGATLDCSTLTQNNATVVNSTILTQSTAGNATIVNPNFTNLTNTVITQNATGHAIELQEGVGNVSLTGLTFNGYGADGTNNAAINYTGTAPITLAYSGGSAPTVTGNITVLANQNTITLNNLKNPTKVYLVNTDLPETDVNFILDSSLVTTGTYTYTFTQGSNINALYRLISLQYKTIEQDVVLGSTDITIPISQQIDREYANN